MDWMRFGTKSNGLMMKIDDKKINDDRMEFHDDLRRSVFRQLMFAFRGRGNRRASPRPPRAPVEIRKRFSNTWRRRPCTPAAGLPSARYRTIKVWTYATRLARDVRTECIGPRARFTVVSARTACLTTHVQCGIARVFRSRKWVIFASSLQLPSCGVFFIRPIGRLFRRRVFQNERKDCRKIE